ncbi:RNA repair domain-containing protein [Catellatospora sp. KI3]|uniref:poly(A) polymerase n=1 Tax=Catellatospora sp. KI3 TaxID=3041620 RepID=UPI002482B3C1|nr:poly(A) polymerase [Catellatospora sp. KI3]MDI1461524.1 RNA repair domain-containing protein [Catellatospora sp. KI3]
MRTSEDIYHRVRWDPRFDPARFVLGVSQRTAAPKRVALPAFVPGGDIPWHRVLYIEADGEIVWDRAAGVDRLDSSTAGRVRDEQALRAPFFTAGTAYTWRDGWQPTVAAAAVPGPPRLRVLTWNTLWDRYDGELIDTALRRPLLLAALRAADADVIALQEVEPALLDLLLAQPWVRERYTVCADVREVEQCGLVLLSRLPVREVGWHRLGPYKALTAVAVDGATGPLVVAATHLTSDHAEGGPQRRQAELTRLAEGLGGVPGDLVLVGDFNDGSDGLAGTLGLGDAWTLVHGPEDRTPTFDPVANPLAAVSSLSGRASRLDRIMLRGTARPAAALLLGDRPQPHPAGAADRVLFPSDHYGVLAELDFGDAAGAVLDAAPTARTALAWLPPERLWPALQQLRAEHDPSFDRWPPHVNILFGFVPEAAFEQAAPLLSAAAAELAPFTATLAGVHTFGHRDDATVWLDPAAAGEQPWARLHRVFADRFPRCRGRAEGYTPHLTLGRSRDPQQTAAACAARLDPAAARVGELVLLSRRGDEPMRPRAVLTLGTGELRWLTDPPAPQALPSAADTSNAAGPSAADTSTAAGPSAAGSSIAAAGPRSGPPAAGSAPAATSRSDAAAAARIVAAVRAALPEAVVHVVGSRALGCELPGGDLDLVAALPGEVPPGGIRPRVVAALPDAVRVRQVTGARVPGLRLSAYGLDVDLVLVGTGALDPDTAVARRDELGEAAAIALSAVSDAAAVEAAVASDRAAFVQLAREAKAWAKARGLDAAPFGGLPGLAWTVLAARTVRAAGPAEPEQLLRRFFGDWAAWDWRDPIALDPTGGAAAVSAPTGPGGGSDVGPDRPAAPPCTVLTPTAPVRSCTEQVGSGLADLLTQELYQAWELLEEAAGTGADARHLLSAPPPLHRRHAAWAVVSVRAEHPDALAELLGRVRGRMRALLAALEAAGATDAHGWPRPLGQGPVVRFAIGLGARPPDAAGLAAVADRWAGDLPGVEIALADGGGVPTLR